MLQATPALRLLRPPMPSLPAYARAVGTQAAWAGWCPKTPIMWWTAFALDCAHWAAIPGANTDGQLWSRPVVCCNWLQLHALWRVQHTSVQGTRRVCAAQGASAAGGGAGAQRLRRGAAAAAGGAGRCCATGPLCGSKAGAPLGCRALPAGDRSWLHLGAPHEMPSVTYQAWSAFGLVCLRHLLAPIVDDFAVVMFRPIHCSPIAA